MHDTRRWMAAVLLALTAAPLAKADPLTSTTPDGVLPDPAPDNGTSFSPGIATAGAADPGVTLQHAMAMDRKGCSPANPCAVVPPALNGTSPVRRTRAASVR